MSGALFLATSRDVRAQWGPGAWPTGLNITETYHNLTVPASVTVGNMRNQIRDYGEVCVYCHTPHWGQTDGPLWNRQTPTASYRMYEGNLDMVVDPQPTGNSLACLSCHDGTIGLDEVLDTPNTYTGGGPFRTSIEDCHDKHDGGGDVGGINLEGVFLDTDFRSTQHPISILYDPSRSPGNFNSIGMVEAMGLKFFDGKLQCMTCHEPHTQQYQPFLRAPSGLSFCLICHTSDPPGPNRAHHW
ncbi:MAG: cytochrome c3 family protein [Rhodothermales bacterium]